MPNDATSPDWPEPRSAYLHVPFCRHRCGYCNFSVIADRDDLVARFLSAIDRELALLATDHGPPRIETLFVGGGTPTHLTIDQLHQFMRIIGRRFDIGGLVEWSMEANPEDISDDKLALLAGYGVNRISLGVQSFNDRKLAILERSHRGDATAELIHRVADVIANVSIDLIFAAPGESLADWQRDLQIASSLPITHVSTYALTFEKGTTFWTRRNRGDLLTVDESDEIAMYDLGRQQFADAGLQHYEISSFAKPGFRCRHNLAYWRGDGWYAAGPGAAAFLGGKRTMNHRSTTTYLKRIEQGDSAIAETETLDWEQAAREQAGFGVRMIDGVDLDQVRQATAVDIVALCGRELDQLEAGGLIHRRASHIQLTARGVHFADTVAAEFFG
ncbi:radical SAM family heme chaperone HemW [Stieleria sp. TO1_6]|uniref:radical SAM family heme chaperone HemW n=1 Tax=Stieleria tagensis TaxID=2956795 RepID=UPI00209BB8EC|nr:radical SAM family heme chaperone HemW [Stieleria tagensis]MCO8121870.1 radical SAM family heme chaperone HemW [Stieleria tagensis]